MPTPRSVAAGIIEVSSGRDAEILQAIEELDRIVDGVVPAGEVTLPGRPAPLRALENLWLTRRTLGSVHHLMAFTVTGKDRDRTEDAAVLVRRLVELFADTLWMTDWDDVSADDQALRSVLADLDERRKALEFVIEMDRDPAPVEQAKQELQEQAAQMEEIKKTLAEAGAPTTPRASTFDILKKIDLGLAFYWRHESDVAHGGLIGRSLQRSETFDTGADAPPWRRTQVLATALAVATDIALRCVRLMEIEPEIEAELRERVKPLIDRARQQREDR